MNRKYISILVIFPIIIMSIFLTSNTFDENELNLEEITPTKSKLIEWNDHGLFRYLVDPEKIQMVGTSAFPEEAYFEFKSGFEYDYEGIMNQNENVAFIVPIFTGSAYSENGFYDYFEKKCDEKCLTTEIISAEMLKGTSSDHAVKILYLLGYNAISDIEVEKNPNILEKYDKIILLHNEYVTKTMFDAITNHPKVIYLYPNALYAEISYNEFYETISLVRGHGYPNDEIVNGFDWEYDNTHPFEFDSECIDWEFYKIPNGIMLNCYPEEIIWHDELLLKTIKEF